MSANKTNIHASEVCVQEVDSAIDPISFFFNVKSSITLLVKFIIQ